MMLVYKNAYLIVSAMHAGKCEKNQCLKNV